MKIKLILALFAAFFVACEPAKKDNASFQVDFEKFKLDNGLEVVFHVDKSDPVVAVALTVHVGSAREKTGRTGFAHLFEHLLFLESENLGKGGLDKMSARIGGSGANGSTSRDRTNYFQTVPKDALEKMIWAEADKLGWFINTVTDPVLAKEKQVVKNEKRQSIDNRPYGHTNYVIDQHLYPEGHPYSWQVIGSLEDLQNANLDDVKEFFKKWYVPNNSTLVVSGDFDTEQAKMWVKKYFDEIPAGEEIKPLKKQGGQVAETVKLYHEDNFASLPALTMAWPTVEMYHPDSYALDILTDYLSEGKTAPLNKVLVDEEKLTSSVTSYQWSSELAGQLHISVRAFSDKDLDDVHTAIEKALAQFEQEGIAEEDLNRIKAVQETNYYSSLSSVLGKGFQLAQYNIFANDPGFINKDIQYTLDVTAEDVMRVYKQYIKEKNFVATSFVPKGSLAQALEGSIKADVVEEKIVQGAEESFDASVAATYEKTPSSFDRSEEPPYGDAPDVKVPQVWQETLSNGMRVYGLENKELPLVQYNIVIDGGQLMEFANKVGVSNLLASMMTKGTQQKTPEELENTIKQLGAQINVRAEKEQLVISVNTLARNYQATLALVEEMLLQPRWDEKEFDLVKQGTISRLRQQESNPNNIATNEFNKLIYGEESIRAYNILGTMSSVSSITMDDLKKYYMMNLSPSIAKMHIVGSIDQETVTQSLASLTEKWEAKMVKVPMSPVDNTPTPSKVYFYDVPNAKQSVLRIGYPALARTDKEYYEAVTMNYIFGGGGFASRLTQELREGKGYTYGIRSRFSGTTVAGPFTISSGVRTNITLEATQAVKDIMHQYGDTFTEKDLKTTQDFLIKSSARAFETANAKLNVLQNMSKYGWTANYVKAQEEIVKGMTVERIQTLSKKYLNENQMIWLVVGDANTQLERMKDLGFGEPVLLNGQVTQ